MNLKTIKWVTEGESNCATDAEQTLLMELYNECKDVNTKKDNIADIIEAGRRHGRKAPSDLMLKLCKCFILHVECTF